MEDSSSIDIDLNDFSKKELIDLISGMHEKDMTFNNYIVHVLKSSIDYIQNNESTKTNI